MKANYIARFFSRESTFILQYVYLLAQQYVLLTKEKSRRMNTLLSLCGIYIFLSFSLADENGADEESDEPPVPVVKEIKEKDAFYSKK